MPRGTPPFPCERIGYVARPVLFIELDNALIRALHFTAGPLVRMDSDTANDRRRFWRPTKAADGGAASQNDA